MTYDRGEGAGRLKLGGSLVYHYEEISRGRSLRKEAGEGRRNLPMSIDLEDSLGLQRNRKTGNGYIAIDCLNKTETGRRLGQSVKRSTANGDLAPLLCKKGNEKALVLPETRPTEREETPSHYGMYI